MRRAATLTLTTLALACGPKVSPALDTCSVGGGAIPPLVQANTAFAIALYGQLADAGPSQNLVTSPFSVSTALEMTAAGAAGETAQQLTAALSFPASETSQETASSYAALACKLGADGAMDGNQLLVANALFGQKGSAFEAPFTELLAKDYGSPLQQVDFKGNAEGARSTINAWVGDQTNGQIPTLLASGTVDSRTRLVLANALYFHGSWATAFDPTKTQNAPFHPPTGSAESVPTMNAQHRYPYLHAQGLAILELPYQGGTLALDLFLPDAQDGLPAVEASLTATELAGWISGLAQNSVVAAIPRFSLAFSQELSAPLQALGMVDAFNPNLADLSGIDGAKDLFVSFVVHAARIQVDEQGTTASAATGVGVELGSVAAPPITFTADHPFLFALRDIPTGEILFLGQVEDPASGS